MFVIKFRVWLGLACMNSNCVWSNFGCKNVQGRKGLSAGRIFLWTIKRGAVKKSLNCLILLFLSIHINIFIKKYNNGANWIWLYFIFCHCNNLGGRPTLVLKHVDIFILLKHFSLQLLSVYLIYCRSLFSESKGDSRGQGCPLLLNLFIRGKPQLSSSLRYTRMH